VPGVLGAVNTPRWPPEIVLVSNDLLTAVIVCGARSWFTTVIFIAGATTKEAGPNAQFLITTVLARFVDITPVRSPTPVG
jgi:hypothetical protein